MLVDAVMGGAWMLIQWIGVTFVIRLVNAKGGNGDG
jgi:hypothetical protein